MIVATTTTVRLDPVQEHEVIQQYENDKNWVKSSETTVAVVYKYVWPTYHVEAKYMPVDREVKQ